MKITVTNTVLGATLTVNIPDEVYIGTNVNNNTVTHVFKGTGVGVDSLFCNMKLSWKVEGCFQTYSHPVDGIVKLEINK